MRRRLHRAWTVVTMGWALWACGTWDPPAPHPVPTEAIFEVRFALEAAVDGMARDPEVAEEAWRRAVWVFEDQVEPALRDRYSIRRVTAVELRFSRFLATLRQRPAAAPQELEVIHAELQGLFSAAEG